MSEVYVGGVGLTTAQGSAADLATRALLPVTRVPYLARYARGIAADLVGPRRFAALARTALEECGGGAELPLFIGSCNGAATSLEPDEWASAFDSRKLLGDTPWDGQRIPIASASCASGMHALYLAAGHVRATGRDAIALAVDILSPASHTNFDTLRVLSPDVDPPWTAANRGFVQGEAAVALRLTASPNDRQLSGPALSNHDFARLVAGVIPALVLGQGTGPHAADSAELTSLDALDASVPLATAAFCFGHTLGASGPLSIALACLGAADPYLRMPTGTATNGRPLLQGAPSGPQTLIATRALNGACAVAGIGVDIGADTTSTYATPPSEPPALHTPLLRTIAADALAHRPATPPPALVVALDSPLQPPARARIGRRLLPTAVLEMTPGSLPLVIADRWGFFGPALCLVGGDREGPDSPRSVPSITALANLPRKTCVVYVQGIGGERRVQWGT